MVPSPSLRQEPGDQSCHLRRPLKEKQVSTAVHDVQAGVGDGAGERYRKEANRISLQPQTLA